MLRVAPVVVSVFVLLSLTWSVPAAEPDTAARSLPTPRQSKILAALDDLTELDVADVPLSNVMDYLKQRHNIEIQLESKALEETGLSIDTPLTRQLKGITLRSMLRLALTNLDLTYIVGDGYLFITSKTEAQNKLSTKIYPVKDLVTLDSEFRPPLEVGEQAEGDFARLIDLIVGTVAPTTWDEVGGPGAIKAFAQSQAIAISQTDEVHEEIVLLLATLRRVRDQQISAAKSVEPMKPNGPELVASSLNTKVYHMAPPQRSVTERAAAQIANVEGDDDDILDDARPRSEERPRSRPAAKNDELRSNTEKKLDAWARAIAKVTPKLIEPASWQPTGDGMIHAVGETVVVRQTDAIQHQVGMLINEILPGSVPPAMLSYYPAVRLCMTAIPVCWPTAAEPFLRPTEARIAEALDEPSEINVSEEPLDNVVRRLSEKHHVQIYLDEKALGESGCSRDTPITRSLKEVSFRTLLKLLLDELDLTYLIRNEVLTITSKTEAENMLTAKIYPVFDLVVRPPGAPSNRPGLDFRPLMEGIESTIAPTTWDDVGGPGQIKPFTNAAALVVWQTTAVHEEIAEFLKALRDARATNSP